MKRYLKLGLGLAAGMAAGVAVYLVFRRREVIQEERPPFAEAAESSDI